MRTIFIDPKKGNVFTNYGYCVVDLLDQSGLKIVEKSIRDLGFGIDSGMKFRVSLYHESTEKKNEIFEKVSTLFQNVVDNILHEYKLVRVGIFDKLPGGGKVKVHQQPNLVDESKYRSLTIWVPLTNTTIEMGTLHVVKGSHKIFNQVRPANDCCSFDKVSTRVMKQYSTPIFLKEGQAVIFDDRLIHWSPPNKSLKCRTAIQLEYIPLEIKPVLYYRINEDELLMYVVDEKYFRESPFTIKKPDVLQPIENIYQPYIGYDNKQFIAKMEGDNPDNTKLKENLFARMFRI